jgi:predicted GTPase
MIIILRNAVAESSDGCLTVESEHGRWRLCIVERKASLELELSEAELPIDVNVPVHPNVVLDVLADVARSLVDDGWAPGRLKVAVVGPPGSGKSTLVRRLFGLPPPAGPTRQPETYRVVVLGREAEVVDMPGGASAEADCTVVVVPLDVYEELPPVLGRAVLVGSRADLGSESLLELYAQTVRPTTIYALDLRTAPRWRLASALASCV